MTVRERVVSVIYWIAALVMISLVLVSLDYPFLQAFLFSLMFLAGAASAFRLIRQIDLADKKKGIRNALTGVIAIVIVEMALVPALQYLLNGSDFDMVRGLDIPQMMMNPIFIFLLLAVSISGRFLLYRATAVEFTASAEGQNPNIEFISERHRVSIPKETIRYVSSLDSETTVHTADRQYRTKCPISKWESILGDGFVRVHRAFIVNRSFVESSIANSVTVAGETIPVSRKYKDAISYFSAKSSERGK